MKRLLIITCVIALNSSVAVGDGAIDRPQQRPITFPYILQQPVNEEIQNNELDSKPVQIILRDLNVEAFIEPVGLDMQGRVDTIEDPAKVAWYQYGAIPGNHGNAILAGHRDWKGRLGSFGKIERLKPGASVEIKFENGSSKIFIVQTNNTYTLNEVPEDVMKLTGDSRVTLITCGGRYVKEKGGYQSRVVVILKAESRKPTS